ncbi:protein MKS1-like [Canna indica]|uniref:Protein MKS1-like n=1 Tax=Canna indica TaxID=4628 RepID=A0AAQ3Q5N7_9LILI|nr:protein MKS1-like [Canna indica]
MACFISRMHAPFTMSSSSKRRNINEERSRRNVELPAPLAIGVSSQYRKPQRITKPPVVIYMLPPKVIHADASEFMALVQRLTGLETSSPANTGYGSSGPASSAEGKRRQFHFPVRVRAARVLNRAATPTDKESSTSTGISLAQTVASPSALSRGLFFRELSPPWSCDEGDGAAAAAPPGNWLLREDSAGLGA